MALLLLASFDGGMFTLEISHEMHLVYFQKASYYYVFGEKNYS